VTRVHCLILGQERMRVKVRAGARVLKSWHQRQEQEGQEVARDKQTLDPDLA
jgi:hypothetical protein